MQFPCIEMRYSIEPRDIIYVKGCGYLSFAKNIAKIATNIVKNFLIVLKNLQLMQYKLLQKEQFKKQQKQLAI